MFNQDNWPEENYVVKEIDPYESGGFSVLTTDSSGFGVTKEEAEGKLLPKPGDRITLLGGFGQHIQGILIGGIKYRYYTKEQADQKRADWLAEYNQKKQTEFESNIGDWLKRKNALDSPFRNRIQRFEDKDFKGFWKESGAYELFVVEQANALFNHSLAQEGYTANQWIDKFSRMKYAEQEKAFPNLDAGHSGNTFGAMVGLARAVARNEDI